MKLRRRAVGEDEEGPIGGGRGCCGRLVADGVDGEPVYHEQEEKTLVAENTFWWWDWWPTMEMAGGSGIDGLDISLKNVCETSSWKRHGPLSSNIFKPLLGFLHNLPFPHPISSRRPPQPTPPQATAAMRVPPQPTAVHVPQTAAIVRVPPPPPFLFEDLR
ncbi:hypothetical protein R6Q59_016279 [Mikania micrantha]